MMHPYRILFYLFAQIISISFPKTIWYQVVHYLTNCTKFIAFTYYQFKLPRNLRKAKHMDTLLAFLTRKSEFPIKSEFFPYPQKTLQQTVICTVHIPLIKVVIRKFIENNEHIDAAIVGTKTIDGKMAVWGSKKKIPTIVNSPYVLVKTKHILEHGGNVLLMVDDITSGEISPNIFHLVEKINAQVVYIFSKLTRDGTVTGEICYPPFPNCNTVEEINENIEFLRLKTLEIKNHYKKLN